MFRHLCHRLVIAGIIAISFAASTHVLNGEDRYQLRDSVILCVPRSPVTRQAYVDLIRPLAAHRPAAMNNRARRVFHP